MLECYADYRLCPDFVPPENPCHAAHDAAQIMSHRKDFAPPRPEALRFNDNYT